MTKMILGAAIAICLFILALSCNAADFTSKGNNTTLLNNTTNAINVTNSTLNSINNTLNSATAKSTNKSDLWSWGDVPTGYVRKGDKIVPESYSDSDMSAMETPSQSSPSNDNVDSSAGGLLVRPR